MWSGGDFFRGWPAGHFFLEWPGGHSVWALVWPADHLCGQVATFSGGGQLTTFSEGGQLATFSRAGPLATCIIEGILHKSRNIA